MACFIKNITIVGFRSYKEQTFTKPFSPRHNVIVGRNGHGKSNFFFAIEFVLSDRYSHLRREQRRELLHEGASRQPTLCAYVEITFEDLEGRIRFQLGKSAQDSVLVTIKRTIGIAKDEYRVNNKTFTAQDVQCLLETAGFSRDNPYNIVKQGKIMHLATMKEQARLELLKEVAGTKLYEQRRQDCDFLLEDSDKKMESIEQSIDRLEERLQELSEDRKELQEYQEVDRKKRMWEYVYFDRASKKAGEAIIELQKKKKTTQAEMADTEKILERLGDKIQSLEKQLAEISASQEYGASDKELLAADRKQLEQQKVNLELRLQDLKSTGAELGNKKALEAELGQVQKEIEKTNKDFEKLSEEFVGVHKKQKAQQGKVTEMEHQLDALHSKRGRGEQFKTQNERDTWLRSEIKKNESTLANSKEQIKQLDKAMKALDEESKRKEREFQEMNEKLKDHSKQLDALEGKRKKSMEDRNNQDTVRRKLWKKQADKEKAVKIAKEAFEQVEKKHHKMMPADIAQGLDQVNKVISQHNIQGVHGPLIQLFRCEEGYELAAEVTAGTALYHVVVENDTVAEKVLQKFNEDRCPGRLTFIPLNQVRGEPKEVPEDASDPIPLWEQMTYEEKITPAIFEIFGKTLVCNDLTVAARVAREHKFNTITLDGERVDKRGAMQGGYYDMRNLRLTTMAKMELARKTLQATENEWKELKQNLEDIEQTITEKIGDIQRGHGETDNVKREMEQLRLENRTKEEERGQLKRDLNQKKDLREFLETSITDITQTIESLKAELKTEMRSKLTNPEEQELNKLMGTIDGARADLSAIKTKSKEIETTMTKTNSKLTEVLEKNKAEIQNKLGRWNVENPEEQEKLLKSELERVERSIVEFKRRQDTIGETSEEAEKRQNDLVKELEELKVEQQKEQAAEEKLKMQMNRHQSQMSLAQEELKEANKRLMSSTTIIPSGLTEAEGLTDGEVLKRMQALSGKLAKFTNLNQKAINQYRTVMDGHKTVKEQQAKLTKERKTIRQWMEVLEKKKEEQVIRTFKEIKMEFENVFRELVQREDASAEMVLLRTIDMSQSQSSQTTQLAQFTGIQLRVNFGLGGETYTIDRLSGGQKSLVALALIFAIQRADPAPFYLFDEIDAALDPDYRIAVANMIKKQSDTAQFITTTFKNELVNEADKHYGIAFKDKVSYIHEISRDQAMELLVQANAEMEQAAKAEEESKGKKKRKRDEEGEGALPSEHQE